MRRLLFLLALVLYAWSALEMHEWVRVPEVVLHLVQHHSALGHHDGPEHNGENVGDHHSHDPFKDTDCQDDFCACNAIALINTRPDVAMRTVRVPVCRMEAQEVFTPVLSYNGSKWNPPRA